MFGMDVSMGGFLNLFCKKILWACLIELRVGPVKLTIQVNIIMFPVHKSSM